MKQRSSLVKRCLLAGSVAAALPVVNAADWQLVDPSTDALAYVDVDSITSSQGVVRAWSRIVLEKPGALKSGKEYLSIISLDEHKCDERTSRESRTLYFADREGVNQVSEAKRVNAPFEAVVPETLGEALLVFVCKQSTDGARRYSEFSGGGRFSPWHWVIALLALMNIAMIVHVAVAAHPSTRTKAMWVLAAVLIPFVPYLLWWATRDKALRDDGSVQGRA